MGVRALTIVSEYRASQARALRSAKICRAEISVQRIPASIRGAKNPAQGINEESNVRCPTLPTQQHKLRAKSRPHRSENAHCPRSRAPVAIYVLKHQQH
jgi:hypothetical protein